MNPILKKVLYSIACITAIFVAILLYHIITIKPPVYDSPNLQVSRIDFESTIDSVQAKQICADLRTIQGITNDSIIVKRNVVVYFHNNTITNSEKVFNQLMQKGNYKASRFILPENLANKEVCPINQDSFVYKASKTINQFFN